MALRNALAAAVLGTTAATGFAQLPSVPAVPTVPAVPVVPAVPAAGGLPAGVPAVPSVPSAAPRNLFSFFMLTPEQKAMCAQKKAKFCASPLGNLVNNTLKPVSALSGGIVGGCCPPSATDPNAPNPDDLKKPSTEAEGAAARIKELEAGAGKRRDAVRYLGTVNCKRFPEAETALIKALREDTNECVRFEAAMAFARGCCCSTKTIQKLTLVVDGTDTDGNPPETSPRVRSMAAYALAQCCGKADATPPKEPPPELPPESPEATALRLQSQERAQAVAAGRKTLTGYQNEPVPPTPTTGRRSVVDTVRYAAALAAPPVPANTTITTVTILPTPTRPPVAAVPAPALVPAAAAPVPPPVITSAVVAPPPTPTTVPPTGRRGLFDLMSSSRGSNR